MCTLTEFLGRHLMDFGVCVDRCAFISPSNLRPFSADILERKQWSGPCSGRTTDSWTTFHNLLDPIKGQNYFNATPTP